MAITVERKIDLKIKADTLDEAFTAIRNAQQEAETAGLWVQEIWIRFWDVPISIHIMGGEMTDYRRQRIEQAPKHKGEAGDGQSPSQR